MRHNAVPQVRGAEGGAVRRGARTGDAAHLAAQAVPLRRPRRPTTTIGGAACGPLRGRGHGPRQPRRRLARYKECDEGEGAQQGAGCSATPTQGPP